MRLFVGIPLANSAVRELEAAVSRLRSNADNLRWTTPESWHITLQFLGNATQEQYECLIAQLSKVESAAVPVQLSGELGCFDRTAIVFAALIITPELAALEQRVIAATSLCGFIAESRAFHPHITLARAKGHGTAGMRELVNRFRCRPAFSHFTAREFLLYESNLSTTGSRYEVKARFMIQGKN